METTQPRLPVVVRVAGPADAPLLAELLAGLSPASAFHRFMAGLGPPNPALVRGLLRDDAQHGALLALVPVGRRARAVGHACWTVTPSGVADLGVLVADAEQGEGIGTTLLVAAAEQAARTGASRLHLDVHPDNRRVVTALRRRLGGGAFDWDEGLLTVDVPLAVVLGSARATAAA